MGKKRKGAIIVGCSLLVLALISIIVVLIFMLVKERTIGGGVEEPQGYVIQEENYQQIIEDIKTDIKEGYFETYMNTKWTFRDGTSETLDAVLGNSPNNVKPIRCEVLLPESNEIIFSTGVIPVGALLPAFKLDVALEAGRYDAVCMVYLLNELDDGTYKDYSSAGFNVTIVVEN